MATVGEFLRKYRQEKNLTLLQIAQATKIKPEFLRAIEEDEGHLLPSAVQAKGFLRLYADFLGLPSAPLVDGWTKGDFSPESLEPQFDEGEETAEIPPEEAPEPEPVTEEPQTDNSPTEDDPFLSLYSEDDLPLKESQKIFNDIGRDFRERRELLSLTPQDIEKFTRLKAHYIQAIEHGRMELLPSLVQGRGMLTNYATFVDLDPEMILDRFAEALQARRLELNAPLDDKTIPNPARNRVKPLPFWRKYLSLDLVLGAFTFLALITLIIWGAKQLSTKPAAPQDATLISVSELLLQTDTPTPTLEQTPTREYLPTMLTVIPGAMLDTVPPLAETLPAEGQTAMPEGTTLSLNIVAIERAWLRVTVDNTVAFSGRITPGNVYSYAGKEQIELLTGNGAAMKATYNGLDLGVLGSIGQVVDLKFDHVGVHRPTPTVTPTPNPTQLTQTALGTMPAEGTSTPTP